MLKKEDNINNVDKISDEDLNVSGGIYIEGGHIRKLTCPECGTSFKHDVRLKSICMCPSCGCRGPFISLFNNQNV